MTDTILYTLPPEVDQLDAEWREYLVRKLDQMHELGEWDERGSPVKAESIASFVWLILNVCPVKKPGFGVSHSSNLIAAWPDGKSRLTVNCLSGGNVQWIVIISKLTGIKSASGICQPGDLLAKLATYGPERWFGG